MGIIAGIFQLGSGISVPVFNPDPGFQIQNIAVGTEASPDKTAKPLIHISRTLSVAESEFSGDGAQSLAALLGVTHALSTSQGQAIGIYGGAVTDGTNVGAHSNADGVGGYFVGKSTSTSTRSGIGLFANGRRENTAGICTGLEVVSDNETGENGKLQENGASTTKGIWIHAVGTASSGAGIQFGFTGQSFEVGLVFNNGSTSAADIRSDSHAEYLIRARGAHSYALSVKKGAGVVLLGTTTEVAEDVTRLLETPSLRISETGNLHFGGGAPIAKPVVNKGSTADQLNTAFKELGLLGGT